MNKPKKIIVGCIIGTLGLSGIITGLSIHFDQPVARPKTQIVEEAKTNVKELQNEFNKIKKEAKIVDSKTDTPIIQTVVKIPVVSKYSETQEVIKLEEVDKILAAKMITLFNLSLVGTERHASFKATINEYIQGKVSKKNVAETIDSFLKAEAKSLRTWYEQKTNNEDWVLRRLDGPMPNIVSVYKKEVEKLVALESSQTLGEGIVSGDYSFESLWELFGLKEPASILFKELGWYESQPEKAWETLDGSNRLIESFINSLT